MHTHSTHIPHIHEQTFTPGAQGGLSFGFSYNKTQYGVSRPRNERLPVLLNVGVRGWARTYLGGCFEDIRVTFKWLAYYAA